MSDDISITINGMRLNPFEALERISNYLQLKQHNLEFDLKFYTTNFDVFQDKINSSAETIRKLRKKLRDAN